MQQYGQQTQAFNKRILREAGITSATDPRFLSLMRASIDFVYHAEHYLPDPNDPRKRLHLEDWQKKEIQYCQWGDSFDSEGKALRKPIAINSPRGFGKSVFTSIVAIEFALHFAYTQIALFSTSQDQANELMDKVRYFLKNSMFAYLIDKKHDSKTELWLLNGSKIKAFPQSEVTIRGYHPHIKIVDEKARIKRDILESAIRPMGRKVCWLEIGISTPFGTNNNHYEDCSNPDVFHVKLLKPTEVSWVTKEKLEHETKMMGDRIAKQELYGEFLADADTVFKPSWIERMLTVNLVTQKSGSSGNHYYMGLDFGKHRDYTAISIIHKNDVGDIIIDAIERHLHMDYTVAIDRVVELCNLFNIVQIIPDGTGVGIAVLELLERKTHTPIYTTKLKKPKDKLRKEQYRIGFYFTNQSKLNLVGELEKIMMNNKIRCPHHYNTNDPNNPLYIYKVLENEMIQFSYERTSNGTIRFGHPEDSKSHDDTLISLMLAVWGMRYGNFVKPTFGGSPTIQTQRGDKLQTRFFGGSPRI